MRTDECKKSKHSFSDTMELCMRGREYAVEGKKNTHMLREIVRHLPTCFQSFVQMIEVF